MPSFWKILCFPNHRFRDKNNTTSRRSRERDKLRGKSGADLPFSSRPEVINNNHRLYHVPEVNDESERDIHMGSRQGLIDENRTKKRRRVQDIFNLDTRKDSTISSLSENRYSVYNGGRTSGGFEYSGKLPLARRQGQRDFGSGYTPHMCHHTNSKHVESMYRYVPKVVQNVYTSNVLEGKQMDDFFNRLHRESSMTHFAPKPLQMANEIVMNSPSNSASGQDDDKSSLIPQTEIDTGSDILNEIMDTEDDYNGNFQSSMAPRSRALNTNFDQIWNSTGEVLY